MKKMNLKKLAIMGLTSGMALTAQGAFADTNVVQGTTLASKCAGGCGAFGARTKANHQNDADHSDDDLADNTGAGPTTIPVQPIAPAPRSVQNQDNVNRYNHPNQQHGQDQFQNQSQQMSSGQRNLDNQANQQRRLPVDSK